MNRFILIVIAAVTVLAAPLAADDKGNRTERFKQLQTEFGLLAREVVAEWKAAKTKADKEKALAKLDPLIERGCKLVEESPKDEEAFNILAFLASSKPTTPPRVLQLLAEHQLNSSNLVQLLPALSGDESAEALKFLKTVAGRSTNRNAKGVATFILGENLFRIGEAAREPKEAEKLIKQADEFVGRAGRDYGDIKYGHSTLQKDAEKLLYEIRHLAVGMPAPEVVSRDLDEQETRLSALKGKVVVLDMWATWCGPCREMIPHEREMVAKLKDQPFVLVSISADESKDDLKEFLEKKEKMPWTHWWEGKREGGILNDWNIRSFPTIYVIDAKGVIRYKGLRGKELEEAVEKLLEEAQKK